MLKNFFAVSILTFVIVFSIPISALAFGEVAGPVVFHVSSGSRDTEGWGIFNNESITVILSAEGDGAKFISFPASVTLPSGNQIYWVPITANIPSNYDLNQGMNITGQLYALVEGSPGQVKINLQLEKNFQILIQTQNAENQAAGTINSNPSQTTASSTIVNSISSSTSSNVASQSSPDLADSMLHASSFITGFFVLNLTSIAIILGMIFLVGIIYFATKRNGGE